MTISPSGALSRRARLVALVLAGVGAVLLGGLVVSVVVVVAQVLSIPTLDAVRRYDDLATTHTAAPVDYPQHPAVGGPHAGRWLACGAYDEPLREELAVHDLEHGTVWISYRPDLDQDALQQLDAALPPDGIMAPYPDLTAPVVVTVWGNQLALSGADDPRLALFLAALGHGESAPEPRASCDGGLSDPQGGSETVQVLDAAPTGWVPARA